MSNPALLWIPAGIAVLLLLGVFVAMAVLIWKGSRAEIAALRARSCTFCGYDLSRSPDWPDLTRHDPTPKCPECGRVITGIAGVDLPDTRRSAPLPEGGVGGGLAQGTKE